MASHWFSPPVTVRTDKMGVRYNVTSVEGGAEELLKWTKRGPRWNKAVRIAMAVIADQIDAAEFRKAFEAAAKEEGRLLPPD
jgi:hypothetical protein